MAFRAALGDSDFVSIRRQGAVYVNKTAAVAELATSATKVSLFTRPRRFGKSTLLSTLEAFFQRPDLGGDTSDAFSDLAVWRSAEARRHHQRYPVLALSFKDVGRRAWSDGLDLLRVQPGAAARRVGAWLDSPRVPAEYARSCAARSPPRPTARGSRRSRRSSARRCTRLRASPSSS